MIDFQKISPTEITSAVLLTDCEFTPYTETTNYWMPFETPITIYCKKKCCKKWKRKGEKKRCKSCPGRLKK